MFLEGRLEFQKDSKSDAHRAANGKTGKIKDLWSVDDQYENMDVK